MVASVVSKAGDRTYLRVLRGDQHVEAELPDAVGVRFATDAA
jgi:hypothetical protein